MKLVDSYPLEDLGKYGFAIRSNDDYSEIDGKMCMALGHARRGQFYWIIIQADRTLKVFATKPDGDGGTVDLPDILIEMVADGAVEMTISEFGEFRKITSAPVTDSTKYIKVVELSNEGNFCWFDSMDEAINMIRNELPETGYRFNESKQEDYDVETNVRMGYPQRVFEKWTIEVKWVPEEIYHDIMSRDFGGF